MHSKIAVQVIGFLFFLSAHAADAQQPAASLGLTLQSLEAPSTQECDGVLRVATDSGAVASLQRDHSIIDSERKSITGVALNNRSEASCLRGQTGSTDIIGVGKSIYPIERVGVIARSVIFPSVLNHGQGLLDTPYPNASTYCLDVANYSGLVTGLIWSMDRQLVEDYDLHHLIDQARMVAFTCVGLFTPTELLKQRIDRQVRQALPIQLVTTQGPIEVQIANFDTAPAASPETEEETPTVSMEDARKAVAAQIEYIQKMIRFAQTAESKQNE